MSVQNLTPQILGMYLGQKFRINLKENLLYKDQYYTLDPGKFVQVCKLNEKQAIKLLLRPMSSMTDDECLELAKLCTHNMVSSISRIDRHPHMDWIEIFCDDTTEKVNIIKGKFQWMEYHRNVPNSTEGDWENIPIQNIGDVVLWCCSRGFDIFQLIAHDLAIDLCKVNQVETKS